MTVASKRQADSATRVNIYQGIHSLKLAKEAALNCSESLSMKWSPAVAFTETQPIVTTQKHL